MFSVTLSDTGQLRLRYQGMIDRVDDLRPVFRGKVDTIVRQMYKDIFRTEGAAGGFPWVSLALGTIRQKRRLGLRRGILRRTDKLLRALTMVREQYTLFRVTKTVYTRGTSHPAASFLQDGTRNMPARIIVPTEMPQPYADQVREAVRNFIIESEE